jgi:hypothetical protein
MNALRSGRSLGFSVAFSAAKAQVEPRHQRLEVAASTVAPAPDAQPGGASR